MNTLQPTKKLLVSNESYSSLPEVVKLSVDGLIEVCQSMLGISLKPVGPITSFEPTGLEHGSCISLTRPGKSWNLALFGTTTSCKNLARALLSMSPEENIGNEELADALGEILNMVAGITKRKGPPGEGQSVQIGLPLFMSGTDCFRYVSKGIMVVSQRVAGPDLDMEVIIVWQEGK